MPDDDAAERLLKLADEYEALAKQEEVEDDPPDVLN
jgi:hypothetical protein